jgi:hypothetical protein
LLDLVSDEEEFSLDVFGALTAGHFPIVLQENGTYSYYIGKCKHVSCQSLALE